MKSRQFRPKSPSNSRFPATALLLAAAALAGGTALLAPARCLAAEPGAQNRSRGIERVAAVEGLTEYRLPNGLRVVLFPDPSKQTITVNITYLVGSRHENYGETGMAHLLEHLAFKGTPRHSNIPQELTAHGSRPNGTTWFDRTNYFETFLATDENLTWALDLEADRMVNSFISAKDLASEMTVVRNEFEIAENDSREVLQDRIMSTAFLWHNYGKSTIGSRSDIENVPIERLQAFYRTWYQPDNAVLIVTGNFDEGKTLRLIEKTFGKIPRPARQMPRTYTSEPAQDGERTVTLRRVGDTQIVGAAYHIPAGSHGETPALEALAFILGDSPSGRLHKALVETEQAATVAGWTWSFTEGGVLFFTADVRRGSSADQARQALLRAVESTGQFLPAAEEVDRARQRLLKNWELAFNSTERVAFLLSDYSATGDWRLMFLYRDRLKEITPEEIQRVAAAYLQPANRTVGVFLPAEAPERVEIPAVPDVAQMVAGYRGGESVAAGEEFDPSPANIDARTIHRQLPVGLKLALLPKKTRGEMVHATMTIRFGDAQSLSGRGAAGDLAGDMLMRGTKKMTRQQVRDELDRLRANLNVRVEAGEATVGLETTRENLPAALRLVAQILREPSFPAEELALLKQEEILHLEESKSEPPPKAFTAWYRHMRPWPREDPRYVALPEERIQDIEQTTLGDVARFHADFYGASAAELALAGDFDAGRIEGLAQELFGDWKSPRLFGRLVSAYRDRPPLHESLEAPDKESAIVVAGMAIDMRDDDPDYPALVLGSFMSGGGFLNSRLAVRIRQKEGLSYRVRSNFTASSWDRDAWFSTSVMCAPQNVAKVEQAWNEEIARILADGFTPQEVAEAKDGWLQSRQVARTREPELARSLAEHEYLGRDFAWDGELEARVAELTPEEIQSAMRKRLDLTKASVVKCGDFAKSAGAVGASKP